MERSHQKIRQQKVKTTRHRGMGLKHMAYDDHWMKSIISESFREGRLMVDIGMNIGQTLNAFKGVHPKGHYLGIDDADSSSACVEELIKRKAWKNCRIISGDLTDRTRFRPIWSTRSREGATATAILPEIHSSSPFDCRWVLLNTLDGMLTSGDQPPVGMIRINTERPLVQVLRGCVRTIEIDRPAIVLGISGIALADQDKRHAQDKLLNWINDMDYCIYRIELDEEYRFKGKVRAYAFGTVCDGKDPKYILLPAETVPH